MGAVRAVGTGADSLSLRLGGLVHVADRRDGFGLASQEPWIQHASVRDNILFGRELDPSFYQAVIEACALSADLSVRPLPSRRDSSSACSCSDALSRVCRFYPAETEPRWERTA